MINKWHFQSLKTNKELSRGVADVDSNLLLKKTCRFLGVRP